MERGKEGKREGKEGGPASEREERRKRRGKEEGERAGRGQAGGKREGGVRLLNCGSDVDMEVGMDMDMGAARRHGRRQGSPTYKRPQIHGKTLVAAAGLVF